MLKRSRMLYRNLLLACRLSTGTDRQRKQCRPRCLVWVRTDCRSVQQFLDTPTDRKMVSSFRTSMVMGKCVPIFRVNMTKKTHSYQDAAAFEFTWSMSILGTLDISGWIFNIAWHATEEVRADIKDKSTHMKMVQSFFQREITFTCRN